MMTIDDVTKMLVQMHCSTLVGFFNKIFGCKFIVKSPVQTPSKSKILKTQSKETKWSISKRFCSNVPFGQMDFGQMSLLVKCPFWSKNFLAKKLFGQMSFLVKKLFGQMSLMVKKLFGQNILVKKFLVKCHSAK